MKKIVLITLLAFVSVASAFVLEDFEGYGDTYTGPGTIIADPENPSNHVLFLDPGEVFTMATSSSAGIASMDIYDFGDAIAHPGTIYGPRWGVAGTGEIVDEDTVNASVGIQSIYKPWINGNDGYASGNETIGTGAWWSPSWFGGPRLADALDDPETTEVNEADGAWSAWVFSVGYDGLTSISTDGIYNDEFWNGPMKLVGMNEIRISGGRSSNSLPSGVLVDNIAFVPEPATMSFLALSGLALLRRRR